MFTSSLIFLVTRDEPVCVQVCCKCDVFLQVCAPKAGVNANLDFQCCVCMRIAD